MRGLKAKSLFLFTILIVCVVVLCVQEGYCRVASTKEAFKFNVSNSPRLAKVKLFLPGKDSIYLRLALEDKDKDQIGITTLKLVSARGADTEEVTLIETGQNTGVFQNNRGVKILSEKTIIGDGILQVSTSQDTITIIYPQDSGEKVLARFTSRAAINKFIISADSSQIAGKPFKMEIEAKDRWGNTLTNYSGTLDLGVSCISNKRCNCVIFPLHVSSFSEGKAKIFATYHDAGKVKIKVKDMDDKEGESSVINFLPAKFSLESLGPQIVGKEFSLKVTALNFNNMIAPGYKGPVSIKPLKIGAPFKGKILFSNGEAEANITYNNWGGEKFVVCDLEHKDVCGVSGVIFFKPHKLKVGVSAPPRNRKRFYLEELFKGELSVFDYRNRKISEYSGVIAFEPIEDVDMAERYIFDKRNEGEGQFNVSGIAEEAFKIKVFDIMFPEVSGESKEVQLISAQVKLEVLEIKDGKASLKIKIVDNEGKVISRDNSTVFTVHLIESTPDKSASLVSSKEIKARKGVAKIIVADSQEETVNVIVESEPYLEADPIDVSF